MGTKRTLMTRKTKKRKRSGRDMLLRGYKASAKLTAKRWSKK